MYLCMHTVSLTKLHLNIFNNAKHYSPHDVGFITWIINKNLTIFKEHFVTFSTGPVATIIIFFFIIMVKNNKNHLE